MSQFIEGIAKLDDSTGSGLESYKLLVRSTLTNQSPLESRQQIFDVWLEYVGKQAGKWCSKPSELISPFMEEMMSFRDPAWPDIAVEANDGRHWVYLDPRDGKESCSQGWVARILGKAAEEDYELLAPPVPRVNPMCGGFSLEQSVARAWRRWNGIWDKFDSAVRDAPWIRLKPFFEKIWVENEFRYVRNSLLQLKVSAPNEVILLWDDTKLASIEFPEVSLCELTGAVNPDECAHEIKSAFISNSSVLFLHGDSHGYVTEARVVPISVPEVLTPFLYCRAGQIPIVRVPKWLEGITIGVKVNGLVQVEADRLPPYSGNGKTVATPDMSEVEAVLTREASLPPPKTGGEGYADQIALVNSLLKNNLYRDLKEAILRLPKENLPRRFGELESWLHYLDSLPGYLEDLQFFDQQDKESRAAEQKAEREEKMRVSKLLASVPSLGAQCRQGIKDWHASNAQIQKAAVSGLPNAVKAATNRREAAAKKVCDAANKLREVIGIYERQGMPGAANAIAREHKGCVSSCR